MVRFLKSTRRPNFFSQCKLTGYQLNINIHFGFCDNSILITVFEYKLLWFWCFLPNICVLFFWGGGWRNLILFTIYSTCTYNSAPQFMNRIFVNTKETLNVIAHLINCETGSNFKDMSRES